MRHRATAIIRQNGKVLLVRDAGHRKYSLPGGGIKRGELSCAAAAREVKEELGLKTIRSIRRQNCDFKGSANQHHVCILVTSGKPRIRGRELAEYIWWRGERIPLYAHVISILRKI